MCIYFVLKKHESVTTAACCSTKIILSVKQNASIQDLRHTHFGVYFEQKHLDNYEQRPAHSPRERTKPRHEHLFTVDCGHRIKAVTLSRLPIPCVPTSLPSITHIIQSNPLVSWFQQTGCPCNFFVPRHCVGVIRARVDMLCTSPHNTPIRPPWGRYPLAFRSHLIFLKVCPPHHFATIFGACILTKALVELHSKVRAPRCDSVCCKTKSHHTKTPYLQDKQSRIPTRIRPIMEAYKPWVHE